MERTYFLLLLLTAIAFPLSLSTSPDHVFRQSSATSRPTFSNPKYREFFELIHPLPSDHLTPSCALHIVHHIFANTVNRPPYSTPYSPLSGCPPPWLHLTLEFRFKSGGGEKYDRICGLWLCGAEVLAQSPPSPRILESPGQLERILLVSPLFSRRGTFMLENVVNNVYNSVYHVDITLFFYKDTTVKTPLIEGAHLSNFLSHFR